jgi:hypothetical protein
MSDVYGDAAASVAVLETLVSRLAALASYAEDVTTRLQEATWAAGATSQALAQLTDERLHACTAQALVLAAVRPVAFAEIRTSARSRYETRPLRVGALPVRDWQDVDPEALANAAVEAAVAEAAPRGRVRTTVLNNIHATTRRNAAWLVQTVHEVRVIAFYDAANPHKGGVAVLDGRVVLLFENEFRLKEAPTPVEPPRAPDEEEKTQAAD